MQAWNRDNEVNVEVHVEPKLAKGPKRESTIGGMVTVRGTVVKHEQCDLQARRKPNITGLSREHRRVSECNR